MRDPDAPFHWRPGWWTRSQRIRTAGETRFEVEILDTAPPPLYQRIARQARQLTDLGLSRRRIAQKLGVTDKTIARAIAWYRSVRGGDWG